MSSKKFEIIPNIQNKRKKMPILNTVGKVSLLLRTNNDNKKKKKKFIINKFEKAIETFSPKYEDKNNNTTLFETGDRIDSLSPFLPVSGWAQQTRKGLSENNPENAWSCMIAVALNAMFAFNKIPSLENIQDRDLEFINNDLWNERGYINPSDISQIYNYLGLSITDFKESHREIFHKGHVAILNMVGSHAKLIIANPYSSETCFVIDPLTGNGVRKEVQEKDYVKNLPGRIYTIFDGNIATFMKKLGKFHSSGDFSIPTKTTKFKKNTNKDSKLKFN